MIAMRTTKRSARHLLAAATLASRPLAGGAVAPSHAPGFPHNPGAPVNPTTSSPVNTGK